MAAEPRRSLWRHGDFMKLWTAETISQLGSQVTVPRHWAELSPAGGRPRTVLGRLVAWG
jgi:hypothetical protein